MRCACVAQSPRSAPYHQFDFTVLTTSAGVIGPSVGNLENAGYKDTEMKILGLTL